MNHHSKRIILLSGSVLSLGACVATIYPRVIAWNEASQGALIASSRAVNCRVLNGAIEPNTIPNDAQSKRPLPPGTHVCDWQGNTGQINGTGAIDFLKQGQSEAIAQTLKSRGFKQP
jgi:hypothetical protein